MAAHILQYFSEAEKSSFLPKINSGGKKMGQIIGEGITFDDVLLVPSYSEVIANQVDLTTWLT